MVLCFFFSYYINNSLKMTHSQDIKDVQGHQGCLTRRKLITKVFILSNKTNIQPFLLGRLFKSL